MSNIRLSISILLLFCAIPLLADCRTPIAPLGEPMVHPAEVHGIALSPDGKRAATGASDNRLRIWDATTGKLHGEPLEHAGAVYPVTFSPDSRLVVAGTQGGAKLWEVESWKALAAFPHRGFVYSVTFRPDGDAVLAGSHDGPNEGTAQLWNVRTGQPIGEAVHQRFYAVAFSPNGKLAACSGNGNTVQLLDGMTGKLLPIEFKHEGSVVQPRQRSAVDGKPRQDRPRVGRCDRQADHAAAGAQGSGADGGFQSAWNQRVDGKRGWDSTTLGRDDR